MEFEAASSTLSENPAWLAGEIYSEIISDNGIGLISINSELQVISHNEISGRFFRKITGRNIAAPESVQNIFGQKAADELAAFMKQDQSFKSRKIWQLKTFDQQELYLQATVLRPEKPSHPDLALIISFNDVTNEKNIEIKLDLARDLKSSFFSQSNDAILIQDFVSGKIVDFNESAIKLLDTQAKELINRSIFDFIDLPEEEKESFLHQVKKEGSITKDYLFQTDKSNIFWGNIGISIIQSEPPLALVRITDITGIYESKLSLLQSQHQLKNILSVIPCAYVLSDISGNVVEYNDQFAAVYEDYIGTKITTGQNLRNNLNSEDLQLIVSWLYDSVSGVSGSTEKELNGKWYIIRYIPVQGKSGAVEHILIGLLDITERKQLELSVKESEVIYRTLVKNIPDSDIFLFDRNKKFLAAAGKELLKTGVSSEITIGKHIKDIKDLFAPDTYERISGNMSKTIEGHTINYVTQHNSDYYRVRFAPVPDNTGKVIFGLCVVNDITREKNKEIALTRSEQFSRTVIDSIPDNICVLDETGEIIAVNKAWKEFSKINYGDLEFTCEGVNYLEICKNASRQSEDAEIFANAIRNILDGNLNEFSWEYPCHSPYTQRWYAGKIIRFRSEGPAKALVIHQNITERKRTDDVIKKQAHFIQKVTDLVPVFIFIYDLEENELSYYNTYAAKVLGYEHEWIRSKGKNLLNSIVHPDDIQVVLSAIGKLSLLDDEESNGSEYRLRKNDGTYMWVRSSGVVFQRNEYGRPKQIIISGKNITEAKIAEENLRKSHRSLNEFKKALDTSSIVAITDKDGTITYVNDHFCRISGYSRKELIGNSHKLINSGYHDSDFFADMWNTISAGNVWHGIIKNRSKNGSTFWVDTHIVPFLDEEGKPVQYIAIRTDVTNLKKTQNQLQKSIEEKEGILTEVHHRVKNNMNIVISLLEMQARRIDDPATRIALQESRNRMTAMALVHEKLYNTKEFYNIDFKTYSNKLLYKIISAYNSNEQKQVSFNIVSEDVTFPLDISMPLGLIINELISNSLKYSFEKTTEGCIEVSLRKESGDWWIFSFEDNGPGFPRELKISEIKSMGMKLIVSLARQIGGKITLPAAGSSRFVIEFKLKTDE
jgi:PAS domain S-box-containing protein